MEQPAATTSKTTGGAVAPAPPTRAGAGGGGGGVTRRGGGSTSGTGAARSGGVGGQVEISDAFGHHEIRDIKRAHGQSAVKSAAYITGESIFDARVGLTFGRLAKAGRVIAAGTVGPKGSNWTAGQLWGAAESAETRRNARVAQERVLGLPDELDETAHKRLLNGYALHLRDRYGVAATWALHAPNERGDGRNTHGHILITTRAVAAGQNGAPVMGAKVRALSGDRTTVAGEIEHQRSEWAKRVNAELERAGSARRMDHRSHARRADAGEGAPGIEPARHRGAAESAKQRRDPARRERAARAEHERRGRNLARVAAWQRAGGGKEAAGALRALEQIQRDDAREARAAAAWAAKQAQDWERWRKQQDAAEQRGKRDGRER